MNNNIELEVYLERIFGHRSFRQGQKAAIQSALDQQDSLVMLPTGTGKSICYQLSGYLMDGLVVVVSPLLSLMEDQTSKMRQRGEKKVAALTSMLHSFEKNRILQALNQLKFLFLSPEMLYQPQVMNQLKKQKIALFVVDEAHCISQWGFDFRPEYLQLGEARSQLNHPVTMALTATATSNVQDEIIEILGLDKEESLLISTSVDRPNIFMHVEHCRGDKNDRMLEYVKKLPKPGIVYFSSKRMADKAALILQEEHESAEVYHSDISADDKLKIQAQFDAGNIDVVCATSAFGMGIDKPDIRFVLHYHVPGSPEQYMQEIGRGGRDGQPSVAVALIDESDYFIQRNLIESSYLSRTILEAIFNGTGQIEKSGLSEVQIALGKYYLQSGLNLEGTSQLIEERKRIKQNQLQWMGNFVTSNRCLREQVLEYFDEKLEKKPDKCCSVDHPTGINFFFVQMDASKKKALEHGNVKSWTKVIENLFGLPKISSK